MAIFHGNAIPSGASGYDIPYSLRFNDDDSAYLTRTTTAGNRKTWTWSGWIKHCKKCGTGPTIEANFFNCHTSGSDVAGVLFNTDEGIQFLDYNSGYRIHLITATKYRDPSAWYHVIVSVDTTQATASNRAKLYVNGVQPELTTATYPALNADLKINSALEHRNGSSSQFTNVRWLDGYLAEVNFVDGQALTPADFGETDATYGHWKAIEYTGTYGTNGYYLDFKDSGSLGNDANGSNNWTPTNLAATDQMIDSPTNNFATLNPLWGGGGTFLEGNLYLDHTADPSRSVATMGRSTGKWYYEALLQTGRQLGTGWIKENLTTSSNAYTGYSGYGSLHVNGSIVGAAIASIVVGDIMGIAVDFDGNSISLYKNGVLQVTHTGYTFSGTYLPWFYLDNNSPAADVVANFGQDSSFAGRKTAQGNQDDNGIGDFYYAPPAGYLALCTKNLPEPAVVPNRHFNTVLWTGTTSVDRDITGIGFDPSLVWIKSRSDAYEHIWFDKVRGAGKRLISQNTNAESTNDSTLNAFITDGFTLGNGSAVDLSVNGNTSKTYVAWNWKANGAGVSNTDGSITSTVSANVDAGFSIVSWTGDRSGTSKSVGHGLSQTVEMVIYKDRGAVTDWRVAHHSLSANKQLALNGTSAEFTQSPVNLTSTTFETGVSVTNGQSTVSLGTNEIIAYAFHSVDGYSKVGSYTGNGSTDGTFVHCGFKPAYVIIKASSQAGYWPITNNKTLGYNPDNNELYANSLQVEASSDSLDYLSNGFKMRRTSSEDNGSGVTYIFLAFAEQPFKYTNAR